MAIYVAGSPESTTKPVEGTALYCCIEANELCLAGQVSMSGLWQKLLSFVDLDGSPRTEEVSACIINV